MGNTLMLSARCSVNLLLVWLTVSVTTVESFVDHISYHVQLATRLSMSDSRGSALDRFGLRRNIKIGLLMDLPTRDNDDDDGNGRMVVPLPSDHLPTELRDLNVYGMQLTRPVHKLLVEDAIQRAAHADTGVLQGTPMYGHVVVVPPTSETFSPVGAIGCVSEILLQAQGETAAALMGTGEAEDETSTTVVTSGAFRFIVKKIVQTVPFPIAIVDELPDQLPDTTTITTTSTTKTTVAANEEEEDDDDDDDDDMYADMSPPEMMKELVFLLQSHVDATVTQAANTQLSPLEQAILEESGRSAQDNPVTLERVRTQQIAATLQAFRGSILDICPSPSQGYFALAFLAAEIMNLGNNVRRTMLQMTNGTERLRFVLRHVREAAGMAKARTLANQITDSQDESSRDLKVGTPELPPWSRQITKGMKVSYYWNEEWEWCEAEVIDDPVMVVDELLVTVRFEDGEIHRLPFHPDEKARWRPA